MHSAEQNLGKRGRSWRGRRDMMNQEYNDYVGSYSSGNLPRLTTSLGNPVGEIVPASQPELEMELEVIDRSESAYTSMPTIDRGPRRSARIEQMNIASRAPQSERQWHDDL